MESTAYASAQIPKSEPYQPSQEEKDFIDTVYSEFSYCTDLRNNDYSELDEMSPNDWMAESRKRANNYLPPRDADTDDGLANVYFGKSRNKRNVIAAFVAAQRPRAEISVRTKGARQVKTDKQLSNIVRDVYDYSMDSQDIDVTFLDWVIEALDVGRGVLYEGYEFYMRKVKVLESHDWSTYKHKWTWQDRVEKDNACSKVIPLEDIFVPDMYQPNIQEQPYIYIREYLLRSVAEERYGNMSNWKYVPTKRFLLGDDKLSDTFFFQNWNERVEDPFVEVLHRYHKYQDNYAIVANGVLLTDIEQPFLFDHKQYPFVDLVYEKMGRFWMGKSLHMKVVSETDAYNELLNTNIDRSRASSLVKFIASYEGEIEQDSLGAFEIIKVDAESMPQELRIDSVKPGDVNFIEKISDEIDESTAGKSMSAVLTGVTASEILNAKAQNIQNLGLFLVYIYTAAKKQAELRVANLLQFFFNTGLKEFKDFETKEISLKTKLRFGGEGVRIIRVVSDKDKKPSQEEINKEKERGIRKVKGPGGVEKKEIDVNYDIIYVTPQELADIDYTINIVPGSSLPETESLRKALMLELAQTLSSEAFVQLTDFDKLYDMLVESFGFVVSDIKKDTDAIENEVAKATQPPAPTEETTQGGGPVNQQSSELVQQLAGTASPSATDLLQQPQ